MKNDGPLQSTSGAAANATSDILEPVAGLMERTWPARRMLRVNIYGCGNGWYIPAGFGECRSRSELLLSLVKDAIREIGAENAIILSVRTWQLWWFVPLLDGAWHPPILEIGGKVYSQGIMPEKEALKKYLHSLLI